MCDDLRLIRLGNSPPDRRGFNHFGDLSRNRFRAGLFGNQLVDSLSPRRRGRCHFLDHLSQFHLAPRNHIHKVDAEQVTAVGPLHHAAKPESDAIRFEGDFDRQPHADFDLVHGADAATLKAQIDDAGLDGHAMRHKQQYGIFVDGEARMGAAFPPLDRETLPAFFAVHRLLRAECGADQCPSVNSRGYAGPRALRVPARRLRGPSILCPSGGRSDTRRWWCPATRCTG